MTNPLIYNIKDGNMVIAGKPAFVKSLIAALISVYGPDAKLSELANGNCKSTR